MGPDKPLPYDDLHFDSVSTYVDSLLDLVRDNDLLRTLCGGVHLLDFFTSEPDLYSKILPEDWRSYFAQHEVVDILHLLMREDVFAHTEEDNIQPNASSPPPGLVDYVGTVLKHLLNRRLLASQCVQNRTQKKLPRQVAVGMNVKKVHEVGLYAAYIDRIAASMQESGHAITHLVDFGSGQNYLGRALASPPYCRDIVAVESQAHNSERAKDFDIKARIVEKDRVMRNKKAYRAGMANETTQPAPPRSLEAKEKWPEIERNDAVQYVDHKIHNGDLTDVIAQISSVEDKSIMVISLHSCGNLVHHGLRSLVLNPAVKVVALVGCCYNLLTERLGPATYKLPELRPTTHRHPRLRGEGVNSHTLGDGEVQPCDPHGFPMSDRFLEGAGVRLNITARMMAVQAPQNWGQSDSEAFFTRHFYRALLQRLFLDHGVVGPPSRECVGGSPAGHSSGGTPITIGSLRKACYHNFVSYVRGALEKLCGPEAPNFDLGQEIEMKLGSIADVELERYEQRFASRKKDLSIIWSLMAFSAGVVEAAIVVDRWLWLKEQEEVKEAWVESVFEYRASPRNLVVVGIKK